MMMQREVREYLEVLIDKGQTSNESSTLRDFDANGDTLIVTMGGEDYRVSEEAIRCDCGKGLYCPLVEKVEVY